jgi:hypothetical protein
VRKLGITNIPFSFDYCCRDWGKNDALDTDFLKEKELYAWDAQHGSLGLYRRLRTTPSQERRHRVALDPYGRPIVFSAATRQLLDPLLAQAFDEYDTALSRAKIMRIIPKVVRRCCRVARRRPVGFVRPDWYAWYAFENFGQFDSGHYRRRSWYCRSCVSIFPPGMCVQDRSNALTQRCYNPYCSHSPASLARPQLPKECSETRYS